MESKKILFLTGTRADYGKIKPLLKALENDNRFELFIYVAGMHLQHKFGSTYNEVIKDGYKNIYIAFGLTHTANMAINLGNVITNFSGYVENLRPDLIVVHGDRIEALAGAVVGALNNVLVGHIEGGEVSGTIDESIRHAVSKLAHVHFVSNDEAKKRLIQLGEDNNNVYVIGSPDIDVMLSGNLPDIEFVKNHYGITFDTYGIMMYHPVTTEYNLTAAKVKVVLDAAIKSNKNFIVIFPNNDMGSEFILNEYNRLKGNERFRLFPSIRFEYFLTLLKNAEFMYGNSSAGIRETAVYGVPTIDIGNRQKGRYDLAVLKNIQHAYENDDELCVAINNINAYVYKSNVWGNGNSTDLFMEALSKEEFWNTSIQKKFFDIV